MMTLRTRIFIIISILILVALSISIFLYVRSRPTAPADINTAVDNGSGPVFAENTPVNNQIKGISPTEITQPIVISDPVAIEKAGVKQLARVFVERYQTFSTDNNYDNIRQVEVLVTSKLWKTLSARLNTPPAKTFTGVTTEVFTTNLDSFGNNSASVTTYTRRTTESEGEITTTNQIYKVQLLKSGNVWLVDSFLDVE